MPVFLSTSSMLHPAPIQSTWESGSSEHLLEIDRVDLSNGRFKDSIEMQDTLVGAGS